MIAGSKKSVITENEVMMYVAIGLKHLRLIILLFCLSLTLGLLYYNFSRPVYFSRSLVEYHTLDRPLDTEKTFRDSSDRAIVRELRSPHIIENTARRFGIKSSAREILKSRIKRLSIRFDSERNLTIEVYAYSQELARDWAGALVDEYLRYRDERRRIRTEAEIATFTRDMEEMRQKMDEIFNSKFEFRDSNELTKIVIDLNQLREVPRELLQVKRQLSIMERTRDTVQRQADPVAKLAALSALEKEIEESRVGIGRVLPNEDAGAAMLLMPSVSNEVSSSIVVVPSQIISPGRTPWQELDKERRRLDRQAEETGRVYLPGHRYMIAINEKLNAVNKALDLELELANNRFELGYAALLERQRELESKLPEYNEITRRHEKYLQEYRQFDSGQLNWNRMHAALLKRLEVLDFGFDKERAQLDFQGHLEYKDFPVAPHRLKLVIYSLLLGAALAVAVPFLIEYLDSRVSDVEQVEENLRIRALGVVPKLQEPEIENLALLGTGQQKPDYHLQENFRVIRTNLILNSDTPALPQVILVTSAMPQEGKTVVSSNLAISFASKGEKTLLIDADLRRGRLHRIFATQNKPGLSDVLRENKPIEEAIRPTPHENLSVLTCGKHVNTASELLDTATFARLLEDLRQHYQRIIIDTPPVLGLAETTIVQRLSDGVLFVIWSDFTPIRNVKAAVQSLQVNGAKFAGFVLNRLDFDSLGNRYKYFYYAPNYYYNYKSIEAPLTNA